MPAYVSKKLPSSSNPSDRSMYKDGKLLNQVIEVLTVPAKKLQAQEKPLLENEASQKSLNSRKESKLTNNFEHEAKCLRQLWMKYEGVRSFGDSAELEKLIQIFNLLLKNRLHSSYWIENAPAGNVLKIIAILRIFLRDKMFQAELNEKEGVQVLAERLEVSSMEYLQFAAEEMVTDTVRELTNIFQKLSAEVALRSSVVKAGVHKSLIFLLAAHDLQILHSALYALIGLAQSDEPRKSITQLNCVEKLMHIIQEYDVSSKQLAVTLIRYLSTDASIREQIKVFNGVPVLLSLLRCDTLRLLWNVIWVIVQLAEDCDTKNEIRILGGIPLLLSLLLDHSYQSCEEMLINSGNFSASDIIPAERNSDAALLEQRLSLKAAVCAALTELVLNDTNARWIVQGNGIYLIAMLIFPETRITTQDVLTAAKNLQKNAFRALRFLFSMERNRQLFKRLFPPELFERFIDVGHYKKELDAYSNLVNVFNDLKYEDQEEIRERIIAINQNKAANFFIRQYAVYEHLGSGAFGSVYKVKKKGGQTFLAMKEISTRNSEFGKSKREQDDSVGGLMNEISFVKEQLTHPNIVRYYKAFVEGDKLYIVMDLIDGAPLGEHFNSLKEKHERFTEDRIWNIFVQLVLALRYIHKEKHIVHRDLTPNNIMLGEYDKVTVTDFGLARQRSTDASKLTSVVGTILYSCPEVVQSHPYGEKADIWALGCILYQMAMLDPPFNSTNMLSLATKIVEADFVPITKGLYSDQVMGVVRRCLTANPERRPDILQVAAEIPDILIAHMEDLRIQQTNLEKKLGKERKRTQRHMELHQSSLREFRIMQDQLSNSRISDDSMSHTFDALTMKEINGVEDEHEGFEVNNNEPQREPPLKSRDSQVVLENFRHLGRKDRRFSETSDSVSCNIKGEGTSGPLKNRSKSTSVAVNQSANDGSGSSGSWSSTEDDVFVHPRGQVRTRRRLIPLEKMSDPAVASECIDKTNPNSKLNVKRTHSCSYIEGKMAVVEKTPVKLRPISATATLTISPRKVRQVSDPILQMLSAVHKIIFITQLPPLLAYNSERRYVEQFKRALFSAQSNSATLKNELKKIMEGSKELIDVNLGLSDLHQDGRFESSTRNISDISGGSGMSYEEMQNLIEKLLQENGYYKSPHSKSPASPLGPILASSQFPCKAE